MLRYGCRRLVACSAFWCVHVMVMSSAYEATWIWGTWGRCMSCMYRLKRVGDNTDP